MSRGKLGLIASLTAVVALTATMVSPAYADESADDAEAVAETIQAVAPDAELSEPGTIEGDQLVTSVAEVEAAVPLSADEDVVVTSPVEDGTRTASIELPGEIPLAEGVVTDDGTVVYSAEDSSGDAVAVQSLADGSTRIQTVIGSPTSPHEFGYRMDGYQPYQSDTGEVIFLDEAGNYVPVAAPWAVDANGNAVPTSYEVRGDELFQIVSPDADATYPLVADPSWIWNGPIWGMKLNRAETSRVRDYASAVFMCGAFLGKLPKVGWACGTFAGYMVAQANIAQGDKPKTCLFLTAAPVPGVIMRIKC
jgi:hypothetical protein